MIRFLKALVLLPIAVVVVLLAVANRDAVTLSFDPFSPEPVFSLVLPLYAVVFGSVALGILVGGIGSWLGQSRTRQRARYHRREADRLAKETAELKTFGTPGVEPGYASAGTYTALPAPAAAR
ncbi:LapA family protein [Methylobacterium sp. J-043]|uniref:LapA family protein n=1 Tax=Methylorubrum TaxID=2282523 RepID=UPI0020A1B732|nr:MULTISPECIES: LapA family protein [Methylorubrum]MCJ2030752.1 LapA family protein [Methylobacterium sp. J-043]MCP1550984.1 putative integral membrane protein [Methylorubrum zatmanii]MCP1552403.1 putative integral membrane protein [Methylorubrum extorquens]MCP1581287.1 putative integral membrane protein [Methylorubrum extorquens]